MLAVLVLSFGCVVVHAQFPIGGSCIDSNSAGSGVCKALSDCRHLIGTVLARKPYTSCGFVGASEVVCCPPTSPATTTIRVGPRISEIKCSEYAKSVNVTTRINVGRRTLVTVTDLCGHKVTPLIVGGVNANEKEFPHMALLGFGNVNYLQWKCGGTLISDEYVLTAAHCMFTDYGPLRRVRLGELNHAQPNRHRDEFGVIQTILHPQYKVEFQYYDIALVQLDRKASFNAYKRPACLPTEFAGSETHALATGWGASSFSGPSNSTLQKVTLELFTDEQCRGAFTAGPESPTGINSTQQLCAGSHTERRDTCQGDSGGPLQIYRQTDYCMYTVIGITSFGRLCGDVGRPGAYQRVYAYLDWIESIVWPN